MLTHAADKVKGGNNARMLLGACSSAIFSLFYCTIFLFTTDKRVLNATSTFRNHIPHPVSGTFDGCGKKFILEKTLERHIRRNHVPKVPIVTLYPAEEESTRHTSQG